jgi:hypothetical protein
VTASDVFNSVGGSDGAGRGSVSTVDFEGVHISPSRAVAGDVREIPIDHVTGRVDVSFADVEAASRVPGLTVRAVPGHVDQVAVGESVSVAGLSVTVGVVATVTSSGNTITLRATDVQIPGGVAIPIPDSVLDQIRSRAGFSVQVPGLPSGVRLTSVAVGLDGVVATLRADGVVLTR